MQSYINYILPVEGSLSEQIIIHILRYPYTHLILPAEYLKKILNEGSIQAESYSEVKSYSNTK